MKALKILFVCLIAVATAGVCTAFWWQIAEAANENRVSKTIPPVQPPDEEIADFMKIKLQSVNAAMEAAADNDFDAVQRASLELVQLSKQAAWARQSDATYQQDTADFVSAAEFLLRMAQAEDSQGVTAAYAAVATSCLDCHTHARRPKVAALETQTSAGFEVAKLR